MEVAVPADVVGRFIGRKGANVKLIEAKTQTKIHFKDTGKIIILYIHVLTAITSFHCTSLVSKSNEVQMTCLY